MDRGQTFDVVDTPPPNSQEWPSAPPPNRQEWPSLEEFSREEIKKYRDIDIGCYRLLETFDHCVNKYGRPSFVLKLENRNGDVFQVWAPSSLACSLKMRGRTSFIWNHGLVKCENNGNFVLQFQPLLNTFDVHVFTMGRGRSGIIEHSQKKPKILSTLQRKNPQIYFNSVDPEKDVSFVFSGDIIQALKKMDPKDVAAVVLRH